MHFRFNDTTKDSRQLGLSGTRPLSATMTDQLLSFVEKYLVASDAKCSRHCNMNAKFVTLNKTTSSIVGAYACPENYVSRIVYFAENPEPKWFERFIVDQVGKINSRDIRTATRHGWELGGSAESEIARVSKSREIMQYYWTPYPKTDEEKNSGVFICEGCGNLYSKLKIDESKLCQKCRG